MATININLVTLEYVCNNDDEHEGADDQVIAHQPLNDIVDSGTLICPECGDDMELVGADLDEDEECGHNETDLTDEEGYVVCLDCGRVNVPGDGWLDSSGRA